MLNYLRKLDVLKSFFTTGTKNSTLQENMKINNNITTGHKEDDPTQDNSMTVSLPSKGTKQNIQKFDHPLIGILTAKKKSRIKSLKAYQNHHKMDGKLFAFTARDIDWKRKKINGIHQVDGQWKEMLFPFPGAVYNRSYTCRKKHLQRLEKVIGKNRCFNHINRFNKWSMHQAFTGSNINEYLPETCLYNKINLLKMLKKHKTVFLKPCYGLNAKRIYRLEMTKDGFMKIYQQTYDPTFQFTDYKSFMKKIKQLTSGKKFILQKEINLYKVNARCFDIRVMVQKNGQGEWKATACASRVASKFSFITNLAYAIHSAEGILKEVYPNKTHHFKIINTIKTIKKVSIQAAKSLELKYGHLGEVSVDFGIDKDKKIWIIEANGQPQKSLFNFLDDLNTKTTIYQSPLEYAYYLAKK